MTFGKELTLNNVLYVLEVCKNLISRSLLNKYEYWMVFEQNKIVLYKNRMYVGNGCVSNRLFKLNVIVVKLKNNRAISRGGQLKI